MRQALNAIASLLTNGSADALTLDWVALRYKHTSAIRFALSEKYAPATANKMLGALRRVLKEALLLDLIEPTDYQKATAFDLHNFRECQFQTYDMFIQEQQMSNTATIMMLNRLSLLLDTMLS